MENTMVIGIILMIFGIIGSIVPAVPGPIFSFAGIALLFFEKGSSEIPVFHLIVFGLLTALIILGDYIAPILGAKFAGSTKAGTYGAIAGALVGLIFFPPLGIFIGAFLGAVVGEIQSGKKGTAVFKAGLGVLLGGVAMILIQVAFSVAAAIYFFVNL